MCKAAAYIAMPELVAVENMVAVEVAAVAQRVVEPLLVFHSSDKNSLELNSHTSGNMAYFSLRFYSRKVYLFHR